MPLFGPPDLKKMKSNGDLKGIIKALEYRKEEAVRLQAIEILGEMKIPDAVEPLTALLKEQDPIFSQAVYALGEIGGKRALKGLYDQIFATSCPEQVVQTMAKIDYASSVKELAATLFMNPDRSKLQKAAFALGAIGGKQAFDALLPLVFVEDQEVAGYAATALRGFGANAIPPLLSALKRVDTKESPSAKRALIQLGDVAIEPLAAAFLEEGWEIKKLLLDILRKLFWKPTPGSDAELIFQIMDCNWDAVIQRGAAAVPLLRSKLDVDPFGKDEIMKVLGKIGGKEAFEALLPMLDYHGWIEDKVRADTARILGQAGWQPTADANGARYWIVTGHCEECVKIGAPAIAPLADALDGDHKKEAAKALRGIYQNGGLDDAARKKLLAARDTITAAHTDRHKDESLPEPDKCEIGPLHIDDHNDEGIGIDFPL